MPHLNELHLTLTFPIINLSSGSLENNVGKKVTIVQSIADPDLRQGCSDSLRCIELTQSILECTGSGLSQLAIRSGDFVEEGTSQPEMTTFFDDRETFRGLLSEVMKSASTLKSLEMELDLVCLSSNALEFVVSCPKLSKLELLLKTTREGGRQLLDFPLVDHSSQLKHLDLSTDKVDLDLSSKGFENWVGTRLEVLRLESVNISNESFSRVINSNPSIVNLTLINVLVSKGSFNFTKDSLSKLQTLIVWMTEGGDWNDKAVKGVDEILSLLPFCNSTLTDLDIKDDNQTTKYEPINLVFPKLANLTITSKSNNLANLLTFNLPNIQVVSVNPRLTGAQAIADLLVSLDLSSSLGRIELLNPLRAQQEEIDSFVLPKFKSQSLSFPNVRSVNLGPKALPLLSLLSRCNFGRLDDLDIEFSQLKLDSKQILMDLYSILKSNSSSLAQLRLHQSGDTILDSYYVRGIDSVKDTDIFYPNLAVLDEIEPIAFTNLRSLIVNSPVLRRYFDRCLCPNLGEGRERYSYRSE